MYKLDRKLGKGGFGQVYVGRRVTGGVGMHGADAYEVSSYSEFVSVKLLMKLILVLIAGHVFHCRLL